MGWVRFGGRKKQTGRFQFHSALSNQANATTSVKNPYEIYSLFKGTTEHSPTIMPQALTRPISFFSATDDCPAALAVSAAASSLVLGAALPLCLGPSVMLLIEMFSPWCWAVMLEPRTAGQISDRDSNVHIYSPYTISPKICYVPFISPFLSTWGCSEAWVNKYCV